MDGLMETPLMCYRNWLLNQTDCGYMS